MPKQGKIQETSVLLVLFPRDFVGEEEIPTARLERDLQLQRFGF